MDYNNVAKSQLLDSSEKAQDLSLLREGWSWVKAHPLETTAAVATLGLGTAFAARALLSAERGAAGLAESALATKGFPEISLGGPLEPGLAATPGKVETTVLTVGADSAACAADRDEVFLDSQLFGGHHPLINKLPEDFDPELAAKEHLDFLRNWRAGKLESPEIKIAWGSEATRGWSPAEAADLTGRLKAAGFQAKGVAGESKGW